MIWIFAAGVVVGMACPMLAFLVFKPILEKYYEALVSESKRGVLPVVQAAVKQALRDAGNPYTPDNKQEKGDRRGVFKPKRDNDEDE